MKLDDHASYPVVALIILCGVGLGIFGTLSKKGADELKADSQTIEARITTSEIREKNGKKSHSVKYAFAVAEGQPEVTRGDFLGRKDLWSTLAESEYQSAVSSGKLKVRYAKTNPANNMPESESGESSAALFWGLGGVFLVIGIIGLVRRVRLGTETA